ncbi:unnamed protein product [Orchesella dallaii]|uniref:F-box only protein 22 n=1 Tax=Orchesella dallaii TaxID=48710 RepID=A0ABP1QBP8_9HEXA
MSTKSTPSSSSTPTSLDVANAENPKRPRVTTEDPKEKSEQDGCSNPDLDSDLFDKSDELAPPVFVSQYHIVKHILQYLGIADVLRATLVSKQWAEIGQRVRKQRKNNPYTILYHTYMPDHKLAFEYFNGFEVSEEAKQLVKPASKERHRVKNYEYPALLSEARSVVKKTFLDSYDEPQLLVTFATTAIDNSVLREIKINGERSEERMEWILRGLQKTVPCLSSISCGVIATLPNTCKALEMERSTYPCLSSLAIPKVQGLTIKMFGVTNQQNKMLKKKMEVDNVKNILGIDKKNEDKLKGIVFLQRATYRTAPIATGILQYLRANPNVALGGGIHEGVFVTGLPDDNVIAGGMLIYGEENVRVSSIALQETKISPNNQKKIDQLKSSLIPDGKSFAIMFACNGRGIGMHDRPNVEADLFNAHFPTTPLVGAFTLGEFCHELISTGSNAPVESPRRIDFAYTTVFVMVSYKHTSETQDPK